LLYLPEEEPRWKGYEKREILDTILIHDSAEAYVGDLLPHQKNQAAREREEETFDYLGVLSTYTELGNLERVRTLWENFEQRSTLNGRIAHEIDRLENLIQLCLYVKQGHSISDCLIALFSTGHKAPAIHRRPCERQAGRSALHSVPRHGDGSFRPHVDKGGSEGHSTSYQATSRSQDSSLRILSFEIGFSNGGTSLWNRPEASANPKMCATTDWAPSTKM
jgi:HD domain